MRVGAGALRQIVPMLEELGIRRPLVVTDPFLGGHPLLRQLLDPIEAAGLEVAVFSETVSDPTDTVIVEGARRLMEGGHDGMIGFGGGSPIDTAKAMAILAANGRAIRDYKVPNPIPGAGVPLIAVPTTAGTGSEVTKFTIITDVATDEKMLIAGNVLVPQGAIVDFELTMALPKRLTADTGVDALVHAVEAYVSQKRNAVSAMYAVDAMKRIWSNLRDAYHQPDNRAAREEMMLGATHAGLAFSTASVALVHGMSRPIGAHFHVHHGLSNAMLFPAVTGFSLSGAPSHYADCARVMGIAEASESDASAGEKLVRALKELNDDLEVPTPKAYGIEEDKYRSLMPLMAEQALASGSPNNNPRIPTVDEIVHLYDEVYV